MCLIIINTSSLYVYLVYFNLIFIVSLGSGKTFTMKPLPLKASHDILRLMNHAYRNQGFQLFVSFFEIYGGKLFDLLNERKYVLLFKLPNSIVLWEIFY